MRLSAYPWKTFWPATCLVWLLLVTVGTAASPVCTVCKKPIESGSWFEIEGKAYHWKHFTCANCGQPIGDQRYMKHEGQFYDSTCYVQRFAPRCAFCGKPLDQKWLNIDDTTYHEDCYLNHVADRCALCGKPITGPYMYDDFGAKIHADHMNEAMQCEYCSRIISAGSDGGEKYSDGRVVCGFCLKSVIEDKREADSLMQVVKQMLAQEGIVIKSKKLPLELVSRSKMNSISQDTTYRLAGYTKLKQTTAIGGLIKSNDIKIFILDRMPRINFIATAAHELMHVWLGLNDRFDTSPELAEGSCNYAAFLVLRQYPVGADYVIDHMEKDKDPIYGEGFRRVKSFAETAGTSAWLDYLKREDRPPWERR